VFSFKRFSPLEACGVRGLAQKKTQCVKPCCTRLYRLFLGRMMTQLLLWGNAYVQIVRGKDGQVLELWPLLPAGMEISRDEKTKQLVYRHTEGMKTTEYKPEQIFHLPGLSFDGVQGLSPIAMAREAIGLALATEEFGARFFGNGAHPGRHP